MGSSEGGHGPRLAPPASRPGKGRRQGLGSCAAVARAPGTEACWLGSGEHPLLCPQLRAHPRLRLPDCGTLPGHMGAGTCAHLPLPIDLCVF